MQRNPDELRDFCLVPAGILRAYKQFLHMYSWQGNLLYSTDIQGMIDGIYASQNCLILRSLTTYIVADLNSESVLYHKKEVDQSSFRLWISMSLPTQSYFLDIPCSSVSINENRICKVVYLNKEKLLIVGHDKGEINIWNTALFEEKKGNVLLSKKLEVPSNYSICSLMVNDFEIIGSFRSINMDPLLWFWDKITGKLLTILRFKGGHHCTVNLKEEDIIIGEDSGNINIWKPTFMYQSYPPEDYYDFAQLALLNLFKI